MIKLTCKVCGVSSNLHRAGDFEERLTPCFNTRTDIIEYWLILLVEVLQKKEESAGLKW